MSDYPDTLVGAILRAHRLAERARCCPVTVADLYRYEMDCQSWNGSGALDWIDAATRCLEAGHVPGLRLAGENGQRAVVADPDWAARPYWDQRLKALAER